jgi:hypothetical protein
MCLGQLRTGINSYLPGRPFQRLNAQSLTVAPTVGQAKTVGGVVYENDSQYAGQDGGESSTTEPAKSMRIA